MNKPLLLTQEEARTIQHALCALNVIGAPMLTTAIHRPKGRLRDLDETIVFQWHENDAGACEVCIFTSRKTSHGVSITFTTDAKIEHHADQNRFFKAYGLND